MISLNGCGQIRARLGSIPRNAVFTERVIVSGGSGLRTTILRNGQLSCASGRENSLLLAGFNCTERTSPTTPTTSTGTLPFVISNVLLIGFWSHNAVFAP